ncbi:hypothetical protein P4244_12420 [Bacillus thuringiensis]|nr:hypothetical protein [Bacillus thuringiensis]
MDITLAGLENCFNEVVTEEANYVAVQIEMDGFPSDQVIINDKHNFVSKLEYYKKTYNEKTARNHAQEIKRIYNYKDFTEQPHHWSIYTCMGFSRTAKYAV